MKLKFSHLECGLSNEDAEEEVVEAPLFNGPPDSAVGNEGGGGGLGGAIQVHHCLGLLRLAYIY